MDQKKTAIIDNPSTTAEQEEQLRLSEQKLSEKFVDQIVADIDTRSETGEEAKVAQQIASVEAGSSLDENRKAEIADKLGVKDRLKKIAREIQKLHHQYRYKIYSALNENRTDDRYRYEVGEAGYRVKEGEILELAETDLKLAVARFEKDVEDKNLFPQGYNRLNGSDLERELSKKVWAVVQPALQKSVLEGIAAASEFSAGKTRQLSDYEIERGIKDALSSEVVSPEEIKQALLQTPEIANNIWNSYWGDKLDFKDYDLPQFIDAAYQQGNLKTAYFLVDKYQRSFPKHEYIPGEGLRTSLRVLYDTGHFKDIGQNFEKYQPYFRALPKLEMETIVGEIYTKYPVYLYNLKEMISLNPPQREKIIMAMKSNEQFAQLADNKNAEALGIDPRTQQEALESYIAYDPMAVTKQCLDSSRITLSAGQKHKVFKGMMEKGAKDDENDKRYLSRVPKESHTRTLLKKETIAALDLTPNQISEVFDLFIERFGDRNSFSEEDRDAFQALGPDFQKLVIRRLAEKLDIDPAVQNLILKDFAEDPERPLKILDNLSGHKVFESRQPYQYYQTMFSEDEVIHLVKYKRGFIPQLQKFYDRMPALMENEETLQFLVKNPDLWHMVERSIDEVVKIPAEDLSRKLLWLVVNNPGEGDKIIELIKEEPRLVEDDWIVKKILSNYESKDALVNFFQNHQDFGKDLLSSALYRFSEDPEHEAEIVKMAQITPELIVNYKYADSFHEVCKNFETYRPYLDKYNSAREGFTDYLKNAGSKGYSPLFDRWVIEYFGTHPENTDAFFESANKFSVYEDFWLITSYHEELATDPSFADNLLALKEKAPDLVNKDNSSYLELYLKRKDLFEPFLDQAEQKKFLFSSAIFSHINQHPEHMEDMLQLVNSLPDDFPAHALNRNNLETIFNSPDLLQAFAESGQVIPKYLFEKKRESELRLVFENYSVVKPLLGNVGDRPSLLLSNETIKYAMKHPEQIPDLIELVQNIPKDFVTNSLAGRELIINAEVLLSDPKLLAEVSRLPEIAPILLENWESLRMYIQDHKLFKVFTELDNNEGYQKLLFNSRGMYFLRENPNQLNNYISLVKQIPPALPEQIFAIYANNIEHLLTIPENQRETFIQIFITIDSSPSQEIQRLKDSLLQQIVTVEDPQKAYAKIENIFIKNNLPTIGKIYKVFEVLYSEDNIKNMLRRGSSPTLKRATPRRRQDIIYRDLLRTHIASGNRSLKNYVKVLSEGESILQQIQTGGIESLDEGEQNQFQYFLGKLETLLANSSLNEGIGADGQEEETLESRYARISQSLGVKPGQTVTERVVEMFARPVGLENAEQLLRQMELVRQTAHDRNINLVKQAQDGKLTIEAGDLLKGTELGSGYSGRDSGRDIQYVTNILQNGSVAREFLGANAGSDYTPFDTDVSLVLKEDVTGGFTTALNNSMALGYGSLLLCVKDRGQFEKTNTDSEKINPEVMELFATGGGRHYGIRTGFPSTEIDFLVARPDLMSEPRTMEKLYFEIAQNGSYIPVVDIGGTIVFTPEMYNEYRKTFLGIETYDGGAYEYHPSDPTSLHYEAIIENAGKVRENEQQVASLSKQIAKSIQHAIADYDMNLKDPYDSSILGTELLDTGSTGRGTNLDKEYDFDLNLRLDAKDFPNSLNIAQSMRENISANSVDIYSETNEYHQLRAFGVTKLFDTEFEKPIDIDLGFSKKSDLVMYASHNAIADKLNSIKKNNGESAYEEVVGNIQLAKQVLKAGGAYKKQEHGGIGGIGVETWILSHGGNIEEAFRSFRDAAYNGERQRTLEEFRRNYKILDAGINLKFKNHDNYTRNLRPEGYTAMLRVAEEFLGIINNLTSQDST